MQILTWCLEHLSVLYLAIDDLLNDWSHHLLELALILDELVEGLA